MQYFLYYLQEREALPSGLALLLVQMSFWRPFQPTCANCHALANRAVHALSTDVWQLAWVGQNFHQNWLVMVRLLCHGERGSSMFCGCGMAIKWYASCNSIQRPINAPTMRNFLPIYHDDKMVPHSWIISSLRRFFRRGEQLARDENRVSFFGGKYLGFWGH